jgi:hypothetical protein
MGSALVARLPPASMNSTCTGGTKLAPATMLPGCCANRIATGGPAFTLKVPLLAPVSRLSWP